LSHDSAEVAIGDALTMIPPATGNGMSMALESAELAIAPLAHFSRGDIAWSEARAEIQHRSQRAFATRLRWARWLQTMMFSPVAHNSIGGWLMQSDVFWNWMFTKTRL
jgi:menaquinone-9 beta-reductase